MAKLLKAEEAATYLGVHVETIRRLARSGGLPAMKVGRGWRFRDDELIRWAKSRHEHSKMIHVLAVDDEEPILRAIRRILANGHTRITTAAAGESALEIVRQDPPDVVLLDLKMPGMSGPVVLRKIREIDDGLPVIIVTGYPDSDLMMDAMRFSPLMVIPKPFEAVHVTKAVTMALRGSRQNTILLERA